MSCNWGGIGRPWLRCQPKPLPESPSQQVASQPTGAPAQDTDPTPTINELLGGRVQAARGQALGFGIFGPGSVSRHPKHGHRQYQPVAGYPVWVGPLGVLPLPAHSLQGPESQFNPDPQPIPGYAQVLWRQVGQYQPGLGLIPQPIPPAMFRNGAMRAGGKRCPGPPRRSLAQESTERPAAEFRPRVESWCCL